MRQIQVLQNPLFYQLPTHQDTPELKNIDQILGELPQIFTLASKDLIDNKTKQVGAKGMNVEMVVRAAMIKRMNNWTYEFLAIQTIDSVMTRAFIGYDLEKPISTSSLQENISKIQQKHGWKSIKKF